MRRFTAALLLILVIFSILASTLISPSAVFAQSAGHDVTEQDYINTTGCDPSVPRTCRCQFIFRDANSKEIVGSIQGGWDGTPSPNVGAINSKAKLEWSTFAFEDTEYKRERNCYVAQQRVTTDGFNEKEFGLAAVAGGAVGGGLGGPFGIAVGALAGTALTGELQDGVEQLLWGKWDQYAQSGNRQCNWQAGADGNTTFRLTPWRAIASDGTDKMLRLIAYGDVGQSIDEPDAAGNDRIYCVLPFAYYKGDSNQDPLATQEEVETFELCKQLPDSGSEPTPRAKCNTCYTDNNGLWTALGCLPKDRNPLIRSLVQVGLSLAGGIALLSILVASFMFSTSRGDAKRVTDAKELLQSAIIGLLFIIFSVTILQFIGVTLFRIPGFGG